MQALTVDIALDPTQAYERGKVDINFFAGLAMPDVAIYHLPDFYVQIWQLLVQRKPEQIGKLLRFALGLPRGHAKTTFIKILLAWLIVYDQTKFILIVCATGDLAENLLEDLNNILGSPNMEAVYGTWSTALSIDNKMQKRAWYHGRAVNLIAKGAGAALRGINVDNERPEVIFCDDMQTRENDESETESASLLRWFIATLIKVLAPRGSRLIIYVGNMYSENCILKKLSDNPAWISLVTGAILSTGEPLWPELHSLEDLMESYYHDESLNMADLWFAEVMNDPKIIALTILPSPLPPSPIEDLQEVEFDATFITIDPAGFRKNSDNNQIVIHGVHDGNGHIIEGVAGILKPDELIKAAIDKAIQWGCSLIGVESVGYQQTLAFWLNYFMDELQISGIEIVELSPHNRTKEARIRQFIQECYAQSYYVTGHAIRADFTWQASLYKIGKKENKDDLMDACAYGLDVRNEYWHLLRAPKLRYSMQELAVVEDNTPF